MSGLFAPHPAATVEADIGFLVPRPGRPFAYGGEPPDGAQPATIEFEARRVQIRDVRFHAPLSLAANGAALGHWPTRVTDFYDDDELHRRYYPEAAEIIATVLGAARVIVFDHNVRRGDGADPIALRYPVARPVHHAHVDYTQLSANQRLQRQLRADRGSLVGTRFMQVNLWRPIRAPLRDAPLAICDGATVSTSSLRVADLRYPDRTGELYYLAYEPEQRWYFASDMAVEEAWLFKNFDSDSGACARQAPHSAFQDPRVRLTVPRESIEVRALALFGGCGAQRI